jgi:hypothetical protein
MDFLTKNSWTLKLNKIPSYVEWNGDWKYAIDRELIRLILECDELDEFGNPKITEVMKTNFKNNIVDKMKNGELHIRWSARGGGLGRRYSARDPDDPNFLGASGSLGVHSKYIKNTIFHYQGWVDYDMIKGHCSILLAMAIHTRLTGGLPAVQYYVSNFDKIAAEMVDYYSVKGDTEEETLANRLTEDNIKDLHNLTIYGGSQNTWKKQLENGDEKKGKLPKPVADKPEHPKYKAFQDEIYSIINLVYDLNPDLVAKVCFDPPAPKPPMTLWSKKSRTMSYFCGILENEILKHAYKYGVENGLFKARSIDLCYDGFTAPPPPPYTDMEFHINGMNDYIVEKTGFDVKMKVKPFKNVVQSIIDARRSAVEATAVATIELEVVAEDDTQVVVASNTDDHYLAWKSNFEKEWCKIRNTASFIRICYNDDGSFQKYVNHTEKQIKTAYSHECYTKMMENGKEKKIKCIMEWLEDPTMLCYEDVDMYPPPLVCPEGVFNLWRDSPFAYNWDYENPETAYEFDDEGVRMFCDHLKMLCNYEEKVYEYVACWLAHAIQKPAEKSTQIVMISEEGAGKNMLLDTIGRLLGDAKVLTTSSPEREVWGSFNSLMINAFLVNLNEVDKRNSYNADGKIKELVTDGKLCINQKGKDQFVIRSVHRFFTTTNNTDPNKTHDKDRRNMIIRCSDEKIGDYAYFKKLGERMTDQRTLRSLYCCLMKTDLTEWDFRRIPRTEYHNTIIEGNRPALEIFLENFTINNKDKESVELYGKDMLGLFRTWKDETGYSFDDKMNEGVLIKRLLLELKLPIDTITKLGRGAKGIKRRYDISKLKQRFQIQQLVVKKEKPKEKPNIELVIEEDIPIETSTDIIDEDDDRLDEDECC